MPTQAWAWLFLMFCCGVGLPHAHASVGMAPGGLPHAHASVGMAPGGVGLPHAHASVGMAPGVGLPHAHASVGMAPGDYIEGAFRLLQNQFLHGPITALTEEAHEGGGHTLLDALRKLFRLKD